MLANRPEFAMVFYGVLHAGGVVVPMDPLGSAGEVEFFLTNTGARLLVFALIQGNEKGWGSTEILSYLIGSAVLIVLFVIGAEYAIFSRCISYPGSYTISTISPGSMPVSVN